MLTKWMVILFGMNTQMPEYNFRDVFSKAQNNLLSAERANKLVCYLDHTGFPQIISRYNEVIAWLEAGAPEEGKQASGLKLNKCDRYDPVIFESRISSVDR